MNRKFSTLLAMSLLMAGSAFNSAWADQISSLISSSAATSVDSDKQYVLVQNWSGTNYVFGLVKQDDGTVKPIIKKFDESIDASDLSAYAWNITETTPLFGNASKRYYDFKNVGTGLALATNKETAAGNVKLVTNGSASYKHWVFENIDPYTGVNSKLYVYNEDATTTWNAIRFYNGITDDLDDIFFVSSAEADQTVGVKFYEITEQDVTDATLNALYNHAGFSFDMNKKWDGKTRDIENIFDQRMIALDVKTNVTANEQTDANNWGFPKGTYFVTEHPAYAFDNTESNDWKYAYLKSCTFIVLSSTESWEVTAGDRADGKGFKLVEMTGDQLYKYLGTATANKVSGDEVSVYNACFQVSGASTKDYPYAINNAEFRYLAKETPETAAEQVHSKAAVSLTVKKIGGTYYLTTVNSDAKSYIFKFGESGIVKGIDLLKTDGPAVYNIRFVNGYYDFTQQDKYLTVGLADNDNAWDLVAKGEALAQDVLATPAYQFIITKVNGNNVTFTNRETGAQFTTKLFDEGNGTYSLAAADADTKVYIANIDRSSYTVSVDGTTKLNDTKIELIESEVDPYAGFWNVADGTTVTLGFSRDVNNTSNIVYAYTNNNNHSLVNASSQAYLTGDLYDAAQWKLNAIPSYKGGVITIKRDYVYNNNDKVAVEPFGDVVSVQKYTIELVEDAEETGYLMKYDATASVVLEKNPTNGYYNYVIRQNADGSVSVMTDNSIVSNQNNNVGGVSAYSGHIGIYSPNTNNDYYKYNLLPAYKVEKKAADVKAYLLAETPYNAWDKEGYVSIKTEVGNYLSMNENRDGIVVDNDATPYYLHITDEDAVAPSFFISKSLGTMHGERLFMFNAVDSIGYQMVGDFNPKYQWNEGVNKIIFKTGILNETADTLALTVKGEVAKYVANKQNNKENVWAGLDRFKWQVIEAEDGHYLIRQNNNDVEDANGKAIRYLVSINEKLTWGPKNMATHFKLAEVDGPTANEAIEAEGVQVIAGQGVVTVQGAAGKVITVANILGQTIANQVAASDNVTIAAPAGVVVVAVDGEATKVVVK